jgi:hypothetical protein|tara:strand:+ start:608 stop:796 length:189 start_codon:yes stop_codon:yes gene_type:complete
VSSRCLYPEEKKEREREVGEIGFNTLNIKKQKKKIEEKTHTTEARRSEKKKNERSHTARKKE